MDLAVPSTLPPGEKERKILRVRVSHDAKISDQVELSLPQTRVNKEIKGETYKFAQTNIFIIYTQALQCTRK